MDLAKQAAQTQKSGNNLDTLAAAYAEIGNFDVAARWQENALEDSQVKNDQGFRDRLELYRKKRDFSIITE